MNTPPLAPPATGYPSWPVWKRWLALGNRPLRRAHRQFRAFPPLACGEAMDIGAHRGEFTESLLCYYQARRVWLVEADPDLAEGLRQKFAARPHCHVLHAAITDASGSADFRINQHRASSSLLPISPISGEIFQKNLQETQILTVPAICLDDLFVREKIEHIDLLKIDIQGAERLLIRGGKEALKRVRWIYIEVLFEQLYQGCALFGEIHESLSALGFKLHLLHDFRRGHDGNLVYANALYQRIG